MEVLTPDEMAAWRNFLRVHATLVKALERELQEEQGLPLTWYDVLVQLSESEDSRLRLQALADSVLLSRSGLTRLLDRMEKAGLILREPCLNDRRGFFAVITPTGAAALAKAAPVHLRGIARHFIAPLQESDLAAIQTAFKKILETPEHLRATSC